MKKSYNLVIPEANVVVPDGMSIVATSWEIAKFPNFNNDAFLVKRALYDTANLTTFAGEVDIINHDKLYYRVKFHYNDNSESNWSGKIVYDLIPDQDYTAPSVFRTPTVKASISYGDNPDGELVIESDEFKLFIGNGTHVSTSYEIIDNEGNTVYNISADTTNLRKLVLSPDFVEDNKMYTVKVKYNSSLGATSDAGTATFTTFLVSGKFFLVTPSSDFIVDKNIYFGIDVKTTKYKNIDVVIIDTTDNSVAVYEGVQNTIAPKINTTGLDTSKRYEVKARALLDNGTYTPYVTIFDAVPYENFLVDIDEAIEYLAKFDFSGIINQKGIVVQNSYELTDGSILMTKASTNEIYRYRYVGGELVLQNLALTLPAADKVLMPFLSVVQLYNGQVVINYAANIDGLQDQKSVWKLYDYNPITGKLTEVGSIESQTQWQSTAVSNSLFVAEDNNIYFVPAQEVDENEAYVDLSLYKLDTATMSISKVADLPFDVKFNVSLTMVNKDSFLIYGGSAERHIVNNQYVWYRDNNDIYKFTVSTQAIDILATFPEEVSLNTYNFQGYLRRDGKVLIFNSVKGGASTGDQATIVFNPADNSFDIQANDYVDKLLYRSTVAMRNGDFLRISANIKDPQYIYRYVSNTSTAEEVKDLNYIVEESKDLVVAANTVANIESPYIYDSILIKGTGLDDTGIIRWLDDDIVREFNYTDLIITRDTTMTQAEYDAGNWSNVTVLDGVTFDIVG
jgi:hypothetical protein